MSFINRVFFPLKSRAAALGAGLTLLTCQAFAAVPPEVDAGIAEGTADGKSIAYALLTFAVIIGVVMYIKRKAG